ncbi:hypothetical protein DSO57_1013823 [Entomophthora muscae]|uniref:Uncharacterized protein n=1 Tax=Entomophthora muscae TaxID=34485 RepID=A0ACC2TTE8_9FUNG|nr:hypothetical protein DSO57_1013823 [Entomophthora muscae]
MTKDLPELGMGTKPGLGVLLPSLKVGDAPTHGQCKQGTSSREWQSHPYLPGHPSPIPLKASQEDLKDPLALTKTELDLVHRPSTKAGSASWAIRTHPSLLPGWLNTFKADLPTPGAGIKPRSHLKRWL